jgi:hypothetical protein
MGLTRSRRRSSRIIAISMYEMTNVYGDLGFWYMARSRMLLGVGLPLIFVPIMAASYDGLAQSKTDQASPLINAARNTGGLDLYPHVLGHLRGGIRADDSVGDGPSQSDDRPSHGGDAPVRPPPSS